MNFSDLLKRVNQTLNHVSPTINLIERVATMAENLQEFRDSLAEQARSGGLDEIYNKLKKLEDDRDDYVENG